MRTSRTRVRRSAPPRRRRPTRVRGRAVVRHQPTRRRGGGANRRRGGRRPYGRGYGGLKRYVAAPLKTAILAAILVTVLAVAVIFLTGRDSLFHSTGAADVATGPAGTVADQIVYTARTDNDAAITLPSTIQAGLVKVGQAHQSVELDQVGASGNVMESVIDLTPRTGNSSQDPLLKVPGRAFAAIEAKVADIQAAVNSPVAAGGRALYIGLTKTRFSGVPVVIVSSGLDLSNPDDFRTLNWSVPPADVVAQVKKFGDLPALRGPVTFLLVPTAGSQPQLGQAQLDYLETVWTALLKAAGATSVTFIYADSATAGTTAPSAPPVPLPSQPPTPTIKPVRVANNEVACTVLDSFFVFNTPVLINPAQTETALAPCIKAALAVHATFALDGWASYEGTLFTADGQPAVNEPSNIKLSTERVKTIANLLTQDLGVSSSDITHMVGHGNIDQPNPDPRSAANRVVVITYTIH
jgi:hypothetical protein